MGALFKLNCQYFGASYRKLINLYIHMIFDIVIGYFSEAKLSIFLSRLGEGFDIIIFLLAKLYIFLNHDYVVHKYIQDPE